MSRFAVVAAVGARLHNVAQDEGRALEYLIGQLAAEVPHRCVAGTLVPADGTEPLVRVAGPDQNSATAMALRRAAVAALDERAMTRTPAENRAAGAVIAKILTRGRIVGTLAVQAPGSGPMAAGDAEFVEAVAAVAATGLEHGRALLATLELLDDARRQSDLLDAISDAVISCSPDNVIDSWNAGAERLYGYPAGDAVGCDLFALLATTCCTEDGDEIGIRQVLDDLDAAGRWSGELRERRYDGAPLTVLSSVSTLTGPDGGRAGFVYVNRDVTEQRLQEHAASHDALTGLPNRRRLVNRIHDAAGRVHRGGGPMAVLFLDLNGFKPVNDRHGHAAGDELLVVVAGRLVNTVRGTDFVARVGGDEFVVLLEQIGSADRIPAVLGRILDAVAEPVTLSSSTEVSVATSIGVMVVETADEAAVDPERLVELADQAMYRAKRRPGRVAFADDKRDAQWLEETPGR
ncbi:diguanylate cyclase domain-containing protein [Dactylosporangium sp. CA-092794]|uniref:diguanylate cyclase domain-containing protein n=1 Tax=Dactylosporangium sp. CA-092794 TaxID=3239929 RepID=UPI003D8C79B8